jgi:hypothetical protein
LQSITAHKQTFLELEEWQTVPWLLHPETRTPGMEVQDTLAKTAGYLCKLDILRSTPVEAADLMAQWSALYMDITAALQQLFIWRWEWEARNPNVAYLAPYTTLKSLGHHERSTQPLFESAIHFTDITVAVEYMLYESNVLILLSMLRWFHGSESQFLQDALSVRSKHERPSPSNPLLLPDEDMTYKQCKLELCRMVDYQVVQQQSDSAAFTLMLPLRIWYGRVILRNLLVPKQKANRHSVFSLSQPTRLTNRSLKESLPFFVAPPNVRALNLPVALFAYLLQSSSTKDVIRKVSLAWH